MMLSDLFEEILRHCHLQETAFKDTTVSSQNVPHAGFMS